ncbi:MAG: HDOD domain-containing protein [Acidobacteria bacterium]|nr:HDOD domain-containing protein [Acidobacteriota bacterium]
MNQPASRVADRLVANVAVARQPIYDRALEVVAYELLFRSDALSKTMDHPDGDQATAQVVLNTFVEMGLDRVVDSKRAFINFTRNWLLGDFGHLFPPERVVIEVLEGIRPDEPVLEAVAALSAQGYSIALDDFVYQDRFHPLLELANIVKIEVNGRTQLDLEDKVRQLRSYRVELLAEKIETHEEFETCRDLGFSYFQGYFLCKPRIISGRRSPTSRLSLLRLLAELNAPNADFGQLASLISQDVSLSYKLLRIANSPLRVVRREFKCVQEALQHMGLNPVRRWASILLLAGLDDKPRELTTIAMLRANMCERIAMAMGRGDTEVFFLVGLFSILDALLDLAMLDVLEALPLSREVHDALLSSRGEHGHVLRCVLDYEHAEWGRLSHSGLEQSLVAQAYLDALEATTEMRKIFGGT